MMVRDDEIIVEQTKHGDVSYVRVRYPDTPELYKPFKVYSYTWKHLPTKKSGISHVGCYNGTDFWKLLQRWNYDPQHWVYTACVEQSISEAIARD